MPYEDDSIYDLLDVGYLLGYYDDDEYEEPVVEYKRSRASSKSFSTLTKPPHIKNIEHASEYAQSLYDKGDWRGLARFLSSNPHVIPEFEPAVQPIRKKKEEKKDWFQGVMNVVKEIFGFSAEDEKRRNELLSSIQEAQGQKPKIFVKPEDVIGKKLTKDLLLEGLKSGALRITPDNYIYATGGTDNLNLPIGRINEKGEIKTLFYTDDSPVFDLSRGEIPIVSDISQKAGKDLSIITQLAKFINPLLIAPSIAKDIQERIGVGEAIPERGVIGAGVRGFAEGFIGDIDKLIGNAALAIAGEKDYEYGGTKFSGIKPPDITEAEETTKMVANFAGFMTSLLASGVGLGNLGIKSPKLIGGLLGARTLPLYAGGYLTGDETLPSAAVKSAADIALGRFLGGLLPREVGRMAGRLGATQKTFIPWLEHTLRSPIKQLPALAGATAAYQVADIAKMPEGITFNDFTNRFGQQLLLGIAIDIAMNMTPFGYAGIAKQFKSNKKYATKLLNKVTENVDAIIKEKIAANNEPALLTHEDYERITKNLINENIIKIQKPEDFNNLTNLIQIIHKSATSNPEAPFKIVFEEKNGIFNAKIDWAYKPPKEQQHIAPVKGEGIPAEQGKPAPKEPLSSEANDNTFRINIAKRSLERVKEAKANNDKGVLQGFDILFKTKTVKTKTGEKLVADYTGKTKDGRYINDGVDNLLAAYEILTGESPAGKSSNDIVDRLVNILKGNEPPITLKDADITNAEVYKGYKNEAKNRIDLLIETAEYYYLLKNKINESHPKYNDYLNRVANELKIKVGKSPKATEQSIIRYLDSVYDNDFKHAVEVINRIANDYIFPPSASGQNVPPVPPIAEQSKPMPQPTETPEALGAGIPSTGEPATTPAEPKSKAMDYVFARQVTPPRPYETEVGQKPIKVGLEPLAEGKRPSLPEPIIPEAKKEEPIITTVKEGEPIIPGAKKGEPILETSEKPIATEKGIETTAKPEAEPEAAKIEEPPIKKQKPEKVTQKVEETKKPKPTIKKKKLKEEPKKEEPQKVEKPKKEKEAKLSKKTEKDKTKRIEKILEEEEDIDYNDILAVTDEKKLDELAIKKAEIEARKIAEAKKNVGKAIQELDVESQKKKKLEGKVRFEGRILKRTEAMDVLQYPEGIEAETETKIIDILAKNKKYLDEYKSLSEKEIPFNIKEEYGIIKDNKGNTPVSIINAINKLKHQYPLIESAFKTLYKSGIIKRDKLNELGIILGTPGLKEDQIKYIISKYLDDKVTSKKIANIAEQSITEILKIDTESILLASIDKQKPGIPKRESKVKAIQPIPKQQLKSYKKISKDGEYLYDSARAFAEDINLPSEFRPLIDYVDENFKVTIIYDSTPTPVKTYWNVNEYSDVIVNTVGIPPEVKIVIGRVESPENTLVNKLLYIALYDHWTNPGAASGAATSLLQSPSFLNALTKQFLGVEFFTPYLRLKNSENLSFKDKKFYEFIVSMAKSLGYLGFESSNAFFHFLFKGITFKTIKRLANLGNRNASRLVSLYVDLIADVLRVELPHLGISKSMIEYALNNDDIAIKSIIGLRKQKIRTTSGGTIDFVTVVTPENIKQRVLHEMAYSQLSAGTSNRALDLEEMYNKGIIKPQKREIQSGSQSTEDTIVYEYLNVVQFLREIGLDKYFPESYLKYLEGVALKLYNLPENMHISKLGYYDYSKQTIVVNNQKSVINTIIHECIHAVHYRYFKNNFGGDIDKLLNRIYEATSILLEDNKFMTFISDSLGIPPRNIEALLSQDIQYGTREAEGLTSASELTNRYVIDVLSDSIINWFTALQLYSEAVGPNNFTKFVFIENNLKRLQRILMDVTYDYNGIKQMMHSLYDIKDLPDVLPLAYHFNKDIARNLFVKVKYYDIKNWSPNEYLATSKELKPEIISYNEELIKYTHSLIEGENIQNTLGIKVVEPDALTQYQRKDFSYYYEDVPFIRRAIKEYYDMAFSLEEYDDKTQFLLLYNKLIDEIFIKTGHTKGLTRDRLTFTKFSIPVTDKDILVNNYNVSPQLYDELNILAQKVGYKAIPKSVTPDIYSLVQALPFFRGMQTYVYLKTGRIYSYTGLFSFMLPDDDEEGSWYDYFRRGLQIASVVGIGGMFAKRDFINRIINPLASKAPSLFSKAEQRWEAMKIKVMTSPEMLKLKTQAEREAHLAYVKNLWEIRDHIADEVTLVNQASRYKENNPIKEIHNKYIEGEHIAKRRINKIFEDYKAYKTIIKNNAEVALLNATRADLFGETSQIWHDPSLKRLEKYDKILALKEKKEIINRMLYISELEPFASQLKEPLTREKAEEIYNKGWHLLDNLIKDIHELESEEAFVSVFKRPIEDFDMVRSEIEAAEIKVSEQIDVLQGEIKALESELGKAGEDKILKQQLAKKLSDIGKELNQLQNVELPHILNMKRSLAKIEKLKEINELLAYMPRWDYAKFEKPIGFSIYEVKYEPDKEPVAVPFYQSKSKHRYFFSAADKNKKDEALKQWMQNYGAVEHVDESGLKTGLYWVDATNFRGEKIDVDGNPIRLSRKEPARVLVKIEPDIDERALFIHSKSKREQIINEIYAILKNRALSAESVSKKAIAAELKKINTMIDELKNNNEISPDMYSGILFMLEETKALLENKTRGKFAINMLFDLLEKTYYPRIIDAKPNRNYIGWQPSDIDGYVELLVATLNKKEELFTSAMTRGLMIGEIDRQIEKSAKLGLFDRLYDEMLDYRKRLYQDIVDDQSFFSTGIIKTRTREFNLSKPIDIMGKYYTGMALIYNALSMVKNKLQMLVALSGVVARNDVSPSTVIKAQLMSAKTGLKYAYKKFANKLTEFSPELGDERLNTLWTWALRDGEFFQNPFADIVDIRRISDKLYVFQRAAEFDNRSTAYLAAAIEELKKMPKGLDKQQEIEYLKQIHLTASRFTELINGKYELINRAAWESKLAKHWLGRNLIRLYSPAFKQMYLWHSMLTRAIRPGPTAGEEVNRRWAGLLSMVAAAFLFGGGLKSIPIMIDMYDALGLIGNADALFDESREKTERLFKKSLLEKFWLNAYRLGEEVGISFEDMQKFRTVLENGLLSTVSGINFAWDESLGGYFEPMVVQQIAKAYTVAVKDEEILNKIARYIYEYMPASLKRIGLAIHQFNSEQYVDRDFMELGREFGIKDAFTYMFFGRPLFMAQASYYRIKEQNPIYSEQQRRDYIMRLMNVSGLELKNTKGSYGKTKTLYLQEIANDKDLQNYAYDIKKEIDDMIAEYSYENKKSYQLLEEFLKRHDTRSLMLYLSQKDIPAVQRWYKGEDVGLSSVEFTAEDLSHGMQALDRKLKKAVSEYYNHAIAVTVLNKYINLVRMDKGLKPIKISYTYQDYPSIEGHKIKKYDPEEQGYHYALYKLYSQLVGIKGVKIRRKHGQRIPQRIPQYE